MIDSVWWYVLAGFILGFILSTLWEWLYFRQRRMRIVNQRIAQLEATVRSFSVATETSTPSGFATGYQSPGVFLEGEQDDVDTVEVIVPASPEPSGHDSQRAAVPVATAAATVAAASMLAEDRMQQSGGTAAAAVSETVSEPLPQESLEPALTRQEPERDSGLTPVAVAVIATALGSKLGQKEEAPQETSPEGTAPDSAPDGPLPLRAILPLAPASAPVSKNGTTTHQTEPPAAVLAEAGIDLKIEQVSNQLDGLIESLNELLENTQQIFEQPVTDRTGSSPPAAPPSKDLTGARA
jgi:hypothetical protein